MKNKDFIEEYVTTANYTNGAGHLLAMGDKIANYSTVLCTIDRDNMTAHLNVRKYSNSTGHIQSLLKDALTRHGYTITEYKDTKTVTLWNGGYCGASTWTKADATEYSYIFD